MKEGRNLVFHPQTAGHGEDERKHGHYRERNEVTQGNALEAHAVLGELVEGVEHHSPESACEQVSKLEFLLFHILEQSGFVVKQFRFGGFLRFFGQKGAERLFA